MSGTPTANDVEIIAHRGASADAPENTLAAFRLAWEQGADAIECDVHLTRDSHLVVIHDEDTRRTTNVSGRVSELMAHMLQPLDAGLWKNPLYRGERIPLLVDVLAQMPPGKRIFIEVKSGLDAVDPLVRDLGNSQVDAVNVVAMSFDFDLVQSLRQHLPDYAVGWILDRPWKAPRFEKVKERAVATGLACVCFAVEWPLDNAMLDALHESGLKVFVWTVDDPKRAVQLMQCGIDGLITNIPGKIRQFCDGSHD